MPGVELTGSVEESESPAFSPGQLLVQGYDLGVAHHGGFAAYARVPADWVVPLPESLSCRNAAIIGLAGLTALLSLHRLRRHGTTTEDGPVLVTGASGGVGSAAVAMLAAAGFEVVASSGKTAEHDYLKELGAAQVVGRQFTEDDGRTLGPQLWGGVVDCVGGVALAEALRTVRYGGAVAASGLTGGNDLSTTVYPFIVRGVALLGIDTVATPIEERRALWAEMADVFPLGRCEDMVNEEIGLEGLTSALGRVLDAAVHGPSWWRRAANPPQARRRPTPALGGHAQERRVRQMAVIGTRHTGGRTRVTVSAFGTFGLVHLGQSSAYPLTQSTLQYRVEVVGDDMDCT